MNAELISQSDDSAEGSSQAPEKISDNASEKKEAYNKGLAGIKKSKKDEQKSKRYDDPFIQILLRLLQDSYLEPIIYPVTDALHERIPTQALLGIISLIHIEAYHSIREILPEMPVRILFTSNFKNTDELQDINNLPPDIRDDFNLWVSSLVQLLSVEYSVIQMQRFITEHITHKSDSLSNLIFKILEMYFGMHYGSVDQGVLVKLSDFIFRQIDRSVRSLHMETL